MEFKKTLPLAIAAAYAGLAGFLIAYDHYILVLLAVLPLAFFILIGRAKNGASQTSGKDLRTFRLLLLLLALLIICLNGYAPAKPTLFERAIASLIMVLGAVPALVYTRNREYGIPYLPLFGAIYVIYYALPVFTLKVYRIKEFGKPVPDEFIDKALLLSLAGLAMLLLAFYKIPGRSVNKFVPKVSLHWDQSKAKIWGIIFYLIGAVVSFLSLAVKLPARFGSIAVFLSSMSLLGIGILYILQLKGQLSAAWKAVLWLFFVPFISLIRFGTGTLASVLWIVIFLMLIFWQYRKKIPWKTGVAAAFFVVFLLSVRNEFRALTWGGVDKNKNPVEKGLIFAKLAFTGEGSYNKGYKSTSKRTALVPLFAYVIISTPGRVPYWAGQTYLTLLWTPVPRILAPWKPKKTLGQQFGHRYGLLDPWDHTTSFNFPQTIEMYANFGAAGVIIGMFIMGIIYRALYEMLCNRGAGDGGNLIGLLIFMGLANIESDFSLVFGNVIYYIILFSILMRFIKKSGARRFV